MTTLQTGARIAIVGAGAIGSVLGALLARAGEDTTLIGRQDHVTAIQKDGLSVDGALGEFTVQIAATERLDFRPDLVLLAVKSQDVRTACQAIRPLAEDAPVVTMQNGIRSDEIVVSILGHRNIIGCVVYFNGRFLEPGHVTYGLAGSLLIGEAFTENGDRVQEIASLLGRAIKVELYDNIQGARWTKLLVNSVGNWMDATTGLSLRVCMEYPLLKRLGALILKEGLSVVEKAGVQLEPLPGFSVAALKTTARAPLPIASAVLGMALGSGRTADAVTSTLQSIRRGKFTEIDYLNGELVKLGQELGIPTPCNARVVELVHRVEEAQCFYTPHEVEEHFSSCLPARSRRR
jgi:2-dehydropantoate 2-reductase